jgi:hypothetical protein
MNGLLSTFQYQVLTPAPPPPRAAVLCNALATDENYTECQSRPRLVGTFEWTLERWGRRGGGGPKQTGLSGSSLLGN